MLLWYNISLTQTVIFWLFKIKFLKAMFKDLILPEIIYLWSIFYMMNLPNTLSTI